MNLLSSQRQRRIFVTLVIAGLATCLFLSHNYYRINISAIPTFFVRINQNELSGSHSGVNGTAAPTIATVGVQSTITSRTTPLKSSVAFNQTLSLSNESNFMTTAIAINTSHPTKAPTDSSNVPYCKIPQIDPFDKSVHKYIQKLPPFNCGEKQPYLTYLGYDGFLRINATTVREKKITQEDLDTCHWKHVTLKHDTKLVFGDENKLNISQKVHHPTVLVTCTRTNSVVWYENIHIYIDVPEEKVQNKTKSIGGDKVSVFILTIDSMSRVNFIRQMPLTYKYLVETARATVLTGLTKIGDNTFPNIFGILSGKRITSTPETNDMPFTRKEFLDMTADDLDLLWSRFRKAGYATMYAEDMPQFGLFTYISKGFKKQPTTHYMRPYWIESERTRTYKKSEWYCLGNDPFHMLLMEYGREFLYKYRNSPSFGFTFISAITHGSINRAQHLDNDVHAFLKLTLENENDSVMKNTILVVMGDHGNRFDSIRKTTIGRLEERLPFFSIVLPETLTSRFPHLKSILEINKDRLTSWFDFHEILNDVVQNNFELPPSNTFINRFHSFKNIFFRLLSPVPRHSSPHGLSIWREEIPLKRTCADAGVLEEFCVCKRDVTLLKPYDASITGAADVLVEKINKLLKPVRDKCVNLILESITSAAAVLSDESEKNFASYLRLNVLLQPSGGLFEALMKQPVNSDKWEIVGEILRINKYGDQPKCIGKNPLRLYCCCHGMCTENFIGGEEDFYFEGRNYPFV